MMLTIGSLFSGIGGLELGLEMAGMGPVLWQVEKEPFCRAVLARHWPEAKRFDDVCTVGQSNLFSVDLICGGFPCQDVSGAGKGAGLAGERSGLWREYARIVGEVQPEWVVVENVLSGASRWLDAVVRELEDIGYEALPVPLAAEDVGAPHRRRRVFVVARSLADANGNGLREQSRRSGGKGGDCKAVSCVDGTTRDVSDPVRRRRETLRPEMADPYRHREPPSQGSEQALRRRPSDGRWWSAEPGVGRVAHGIPSRSHRLRALGNSVVPQCAEVVGWVIRELIAQRERSGCCDGYA